MKIKKSQLRRIIKEEKSKVLFESVSVSQTRIENLNNAMMEIFYAVEAHVKKNSESLHPDDIPLYTKDIIEEQVFGFAEWLGSGMEN